MKKEVAKLSCRNLYNFPQKLPCDLELAVEMSCTILEDCPCCADKI